MNKYKNANYSPRNTINKYIYDDVDLPYIKNYIIYTYITSKYIYMNINII